MAVPRALLKRHRHAFFMAHANYLASLWHRPKGISCKFGVNSLADVGLSFALRANERHRSLSVATVGILDFEEDNSSRNPPSSGRDGQAPESEWLDIDSLSVGAEEIGGMVVQSVEMRKV